MRTIALLILATLPMLVGCDMVMTYESEVETTTAETEVVEVVVEEPVYTPLSVGDVRQIVSVGDGGTLLCEVVGTAYRQDGRRVYRQLEWWGTEQSTPDTSYLFVRNGYLTYTELDVITDDYGDALYPDNPFAEQRVAVEYPEQGDVWLDFEDDAVGVWWEARYYGGFTTPAGYLEDVYAYEADLTDGMGEGLSVMYAPWIGWCGTNGLDSGERLFALAYADVDGYEYGTMRESRDMPLTKRAALKKIHPFGKRSK